MILLLKYVDIRYNWFYRNPKENHLRTGRCTAHFSEMNMAKLIYGNTEFWFYYQLAEEIAPVAQEVNSFRAFASHYFSIQSAKYASIQCDTLVYSKVWRFYFKSAMLLVFYFLLIQHKSSRFRSIYREFSHKVMFLFRSTPMFCHYLIL